MIPIIPVPFIKKLHAYHMMQKELLQQHWVHSHEEDTDDQMVFRPADFKFPRSRGRKSFELKPNGELIESGIAPTDGSQNSQGNWKLDENNQLVLHPNNSSQAPQVLNIAYLDKSRLVVTK